MRRVLTLLPTLARWRPDPQEPPSPDTTLWAFWRHDLFPYALSGKVKQQREDGCVLVVSYGMWFRPFYLATGGHGERLHKDLERVRSAYRRHEQAARNAAGQVAHDLLKEAGLPVDGLPLRRDGYQGAAYQSLFRAILRDGG